MVIQRVAGAGQSEISHASSGGGTHVYISGTDIGSAFAPPVVYIGVNADAECKVQPFTSNRNRLHCIISPEGLPAPDGNYNPNGRFVREPMRVLKNGRLAQCWHVGGLNHNCMVEFDVGATPRVSKMNTPVLESGGYVRAVGRGINGGITGDPKLMASIYRGTSLATGSCGQKDCQASNVGTETVGCKTRLGGDEGDRVLGQNNSVATAYSDDNSFGCQLDPLDGGLSAGFFNLSMYLNDAKHRGNAYMGFSRSGSIDHATGAPFDAELLPRISRIEPQEGSTAGGTDLTIYGTGFGSSTTGLSITVGSASCAVTSLSTTDVKCRIEALSSGLAQPPQAIGAVRSTPAERGVRWQWADGSELLLPAFSTPVDWTEAGTSTSYLDAWFEAPTDCDVTFMLRQDAVSTLVWSGSATASNTETLATVSAVQALPVLFEFWDCSTSGVCPWSHTTHDGRSVPTANMHEFGTPTYTERRYQVSKYFGNSFTLGGVSYFANFATRQTGEFQAPATGNTIFELDYASSNDNLRFYIDGAIVVAQGSWTPAAGRRWGANVRGEITLQAGHWYSFELQAYATNTYTSASVSVKFPGESSYSYFTPTPRVWPSLQGANPSSASAVSRRVTLVAGQRYWLGLSCTNTATARNPSGNLEVPACAVGARLHTTKMPVGASIMQRRLAQRSKQTRRRWWSQRFFTGNYCSDINDRERCCASYDRYGDPCVPSVRTYSNGKICMNAQWAVEFAPDQQAACPAMHDPITMLSRPREKLGHMVGCPDVTNRMACGMAIEGRTQAIHLNQPCIAAHTKYSNGDICAPARWVKDIDPSGAASGAEFSTPYLHEVSGTELLHHEVQTITMTQASPTTLTQTITFTAIECTSSDGDCIGTRGGNVYLQHAGRSSYGIALATASAATIEAAVRPILDATYSGITTSAITVGQSSVVWVVELTTPFGACTSQLSAPLLGTVNEAKVTSSVVLTSAGSCLSGGLALNYGTGTATAFLPWDASESLAALRIASLLTGGEEVMVHRSGGHASVTFTVTFLGLGDKALLGASDATGLYKRTYASLSASPTDTASGASVTITRLMQGGADLTPLPGRYLTSATAASVVSVRLTGPSSETTAACTKVNWEALYIGCYLIADAPTAAATFTYALATTGGITPERCHLACSATAGYASFALFEDTCYCYTSEPTSSDAVAAYNCEAPCSGDNSFLCGSPGGTEHYSIYRPAPNATSAPSCSFETLNARTSTLSSASATTLASGATLTLSGSFLSTTGATVTVCGGRTCAVASQGVTSITCTMPDCPVSTTAAIFVHLAPDGYATNSGSLSVKGVLYLTKVRLWGTPSTTTALAEGSAAGGVRLILSGTGFADSTSLMVVDIMSGTSTVAASCTVTSTTMGELECTTGTPSDPLALAGSTCHVRIKALDSGGSTLETMLLPLSYKMSALSDSPQIVDISSSSGSTEGGLDICMTGTNFDLYMGAAYDLTNATYPAIALGTAACATSNVTAWNTTHLCCTTSANPAGSVDIKVNVSGFGYALSAAGVPTSFTYEIAPQIYAVSPPAGRAGTIVDVEMSVVTGVVPNVFIGGAPCGVQSTYTTTYTSFGDSAMHVLCAATEAPPGNSTVTVVVPGVGLADAANDNVTFAYQISITGVSPASGSAGGGTLLTITGTGFEYLGEVPQVEGQGGFLGSGGACTNPDPQSGACGGSNAQTEAAPVNYLVNIGGAPCLVLSKTATQITCTTGAIVPTTTELQPRAAQPSS